MNNKEYELKMRKVPVDFLKKMVEETKQHYQDALISKQLETATPGKVLHTIPYEEIIERYNQLKSSGKMEILERIIKESE